ncbi:MAG: NAD(P)H-dependent oxidoreductase [Planctomycetota bacterium]|nr:NAD(P)H-dependent oxidoreductase [Planctomycetota bacterium]
MRILLVFYSRTGTTRKTAEVLANELRLKGQDVVVEELSDKKKREGIFGWLGASKDATLRRKTEIEPLKAEVENFDLVVVGTPVWAFTATPAVCAFLERYREKIKKVAFFCTMRSSGSKGAFKKMRKVLGKEPVSTLPLLEKIVHDSESFVEQVKGFIETLLQTV